MPDLYRHELAHFPRNVLSIDVLEELRASVRANATEAFDAFVWSSGLPWGFSAGVDLKDHTEERIPAMLTAVHGLLRSFVDVPTLLVAQVHGPCLGGAAELAFNCDLVVASDEATFGFPEISVGCYPPVAVATLGARLGHQRAVGLILSGRTFSTEEAVAMGLVTAAAARESLDAAVEKQVAMLAEKSSRATRGHTLQTLRRVRKLSLEPALRLVEEAYMDLPPEDLQEGIDAFLQKRAPIWKNR